MKITNRLLQHLLVATATYNEMFCTPGARLPKREVNGNFEKLVKEPEKVLRSFSIHGIEIKAYSKKDAIKKYNHLHKK